MIPMSEQGEHDKKAENKVDTVYNRQKAVGQTMQDYRLKGRQWAKQQTDFPVIMNAEELSALLGIRSETLRRWREIGKGPNWFTPGKRQIRYYRGEVLKWIHDRTNYRDPGEEEFRRIQSEKALAWVRERGGGSVAGKIGEMPKEYRDKSTPAHLVFRKNKEKS
jgi:predicted DNA-binding transcriptional regulator AlpA